MTYSSNHEYFLNSLQKPKLVYFKGTQHLVSDKCYFYCYNVWYKKSFRPLLFNLNISKTLQLLPYTQSFRTGDFCFNFFILGTFYSNFKNNYNYFFKNTTNFYFLLNYLSFSKKFILQTLFFVSIIKNWFPYVFKNFGIFTPSLSLITKPRTLSARFNFRSVQNCSLSSFNTKLI